MILITCITHMQQLIIHFLTYISYYIAKNIHIFLTFFTLFLCSQESKKVLAFKQDECEQLEYSVETGKLR